MWQFYELSRLIIFKMKRRITHLSEFRLPHFFGTYLANTLASNFGFACVVKKLTNGMLASAKGSAPLRRTDFFNKNRFLTKNFMT